MNNDRFYTGKDFQEFFKASSYSLILKANAPYFTILAVSDLYLSVVYKKREDLLGKNLFEVFPDNENNPAGKLSALDSMQNVIATKIAGSLPAYTYEILNENTGKRETHTYSNKTEPLFDDNNNVAYLRNTTAIITDELLKEELINEVAQHKKALTREQVLNEELATANEELTAINDELHVAQEDLFKLNTTLEDRVSRRTKALSESERKFRSLVAQIPTAINVFDTRQLVVTLANEKMLEIWGRKAGDVLNKPLLVAMPELEGQPFLQRLDDVITTGKAYYSSDEKAFILRNGRLDECYFNIVYQPLVNEDGTVTSILQIASEVTNEIITQRQIQALNEELAATNEELAASNEELAATNEELLKSQENLIELNAQLIESEDRFRTMAQATDILIAVGDETSNAVFFNKAWTDKTGRSMKELMEFGWVDLVHPDDRDRYVNIYLSAFKKHVPFTGEFRILDKEGNYRWLLATGPPRFNAKGEFEGYISSCVDITERKKDEQRKNDFIGMVSHEMKTPLTSMSGYLQLLSAADYKNEKAEVGSMLERANKQIKKLTSLINGFLNVSRFDSGKIHIDRKVFDVARLVKEVEDEAVSAFSSHKIVFSPVQHALLNADREKIGQVINNLISNAVKYSANQTTIYVACIKKLNEIQVSIRDEGVGIAAVDLPRIFERFYRVESNENNSISGFGIGLYLCSEIIQSHYGTIWAESAPKHGSTFYFTLPVYAD